MQILLVSHKGLASGMLQACKFIAGDSIDAPVIEMNEAGLEQYKTQVESQITRLNPSEPVVLVSDIPSGSPGNTAYAALIQAGFTVRYLSGMNLPLLLELLLSGDVETALNGGQAALAEISSDDQEDDSEDF